MTTDTAARVAAICAAQPLPEKLLAGAVVVDAALRVLVVRRTPAEDELPGFWELPSGHLEPGESFMAALARELREETGIVAVTIDGVVGHFDYRSGKGRSCRQVNVLARVAGATPPVVLNPQEHDAFDWLPPDALAGLHMSDESRRAALDGLALAARDRTT